LLDDVQYSNVIKNILSSPQCGYLQIPDDYVKVHSQVAEDTFDILATNRNQGGFYTRVLAMLGGLVLGLLGGGGEAGEGVGRAYWDILTRSNAEFRKMPRNRWFLLLFDRTIA
jgi:hypothetical protein